jgi:hypothetical protein
MTRTRVSTTVDQHLLSSARELRQGATDAALLDEALGTFLAHNRAVEIDASYSAYDDHPLDRPDAWGGIAASRESAR